MDELPREFYRIDEIAQKWKRPIGDVLQAAARGMLVLSKHFSGDYKGVVCKTRDGINLSREDIVAAVEVLCDGPERYYSGHVNLSVAEATAVAAHYLDQEKEFKTNIAYTIEGDTLLLSQPFFYSMKNIYILSEEVNRVEAEYPELFKPIAGEHHSLPSGMPDDDRIIGKQALMNALGVKSLNTVKNRCNRASIKLEYTEEPQPRPWLRVSSVIKLQALNER